MNYYQLLRPLIFMLPAEAAHNAAIAALSRHMLPEADFIVDNSLRQSLWGMEFQHPLGLAAGLDKNAAALSGLLGQGFAFVEAGTVTPKPQTGNPKPRLFRLVEDAAVINRMGFNNDGADIFAANVEKFRNNSHGIVGINIGRNKEGGMDDYLTLVKKLHRFASYMVVNISSPNTPGLRDMQKAEIMTELLAPLLQELDGKIPLFVKLAPDIGDADMEAMASALLDLDIYPSQLKSCGGYMKIEAESPILRAEGSETKSWLANSSNNKGIAGIILTNTTISRPENLRSSNKAESGGLSGAPLRDMSQRQLQKFYLLTKGKIKIIGVGGIACAEDAYARIKAGASLVQIYSALVYKGFGLVEEIVSGLPELLRRDGFNNIGEAVGADYL